MGSRYLGRSKPYNRNCILSYQQKLLTQQYAFLNCYIKDNVLVCTGYLQPKNCRHKYHIKIEYVVGNEPKTTILYPIINPSFKIHMYSDHSLCLSYRPDMKWTVKTNVYQYTVPWICEWIVFYEIYLLNGGRWEGKESPIHLSENERNTNVDFS